MRTGWLPQTPPHRLLWLAGLFSFLLYLLAVFWFPLIPFYNRHPLADVRTFTPSPLAGLAYALLLLFLFGLMQLGKQEIQNLTTPPGLGWLLTTTLVLGLPLLFTFPINATDVYRYYIRGRVSSVYGQNPFATAPADLTNDPYRPLAGEWAGETSPYGPVWEMVAAAVTAVAPDHLLRGLLIFKGLALTLHLICTTLIWHLSQTAPPGKRAATTLLWGWNPALLLLFVTDAHNDVLMLTWLLAGYAVMRHGRYTAGFLLLVVGALTKPIALLSLPFFWLYGWQQTSPPAPSARWLFALYTTLGSLALLGLAFWPFGSPQDLALRLIREADTTGGFSPTVLIILISQAWDGPVRIDSALLAARLIFFGWVGIIIWKAGNGRAPWRSTPDTFLAYLLTAFSFRIWYATWLLPWVLLDADSPVAAYRRRAILWLLLTTQLSVLIYGHLRVYALGGSQTWAHLIGVPFTFGLPWILAAVPHTRWHQR